MSREDNINNNSSDNEFWASAKRGTEEISIQQKKKDKIAFDIGDDRGTVTLGDKEKNSKLANGYIDRIAHRQDLHSPKNQSYKLQPERSNSAYVAHCQAYN